MNHFKDEENRAPMAADIFANGRQKAESTHDQRMSQGAEKSHGQRSSHAKQLENRPANTHSFDRDGGI